MAKALVFHLADSVGGAERLTAALLPELVLPSLELELLTNRPEAFSGYPALRVFPGPSFFPPWPVLWRQVLSLRPLIADRLFVLAVMHYPAFLVALATKLLPASRRPRLVAALHGPILPALATVLRQRRRRLSWAARFLLRAATHLIVPSQGLKRELEEGFGVSGSRVSVVPNGLPRNWFGPRAKRRTSQRVRLLWMGRLAPEKAPHRLLHALAGLRDRPWHLKVLGTGPLEGELKALSASLGLESRVSWEGFVEEVRPHLLAADIFVHTCLFEGFGLSILEALACGCAVVAEDCPYGPRELLEEGRYGLLVSPQALGRGLDLLLREAGWREHLARLGPLRARAFPLERTVCGYLEALARALS